MLDGLKAIGMFIKNLFTDANPNLRTQTPYTYTCQTCGKVSDSYIESVNHMLGDCEKKREQPKK
jgi:hypothetical protein